MQIIEVEEVAEHHESLVTLLSDCVDEGASIGFIAPLSRTEASNYWSSIEPELSDHSRILFLAKKNNYIIGTAQLSLCQKKNGLHRVEVEKLMVHTSARGEGAGRALMLALEGKAKQLGRSLIVLDTRKGDAASYLYESIDYQFAGEIPNFALNSMGDFDATVYYYKSI